MLFRDIKTGDTLYIYDRVAIGLSTDKVVNVSAPHLDKNNMSAGMVVDVTIGNSLQYTFKDSSECGYTANLVISADRSAILREVEMQKANNETQIMRVDQLKEELPKLDIIIDSLNPDLKQKKVQEERMNKMEESIASMKEMVEILIKQKNGSK